MKVIDAIAVILKKEGVEFMACYPTTPIIDAVAAVGIRPIVCRQERVGAGIADGYSRIKNGKPVGVFAMQEGPGAENAFPGIATAYSDSVPLLVLPTAYPLNTSQVFHYFRTSRAFESVTKNIEELRVADQVVEVMRRAFSLLKMGRPGPVMVEIPHDIAVQEVGDLAGQYKPVKRTCSGANARDVEEAARVLVQAKNPVIYAGQGVLYAEATPELVQLAELLQVPVTTSLEGKSGFPEDHPLALGSGAGCMSRACFEFLQKADVVLGIGTSLTKYGIVSATLPPGKVIIQATNDEREINKHYAVDYPLLGDAKLVLAQFVEAVKDQLGKKLRKENGVVAEVKKLKDVWLEEWMPKLTSRDVPISPYRVIWEFMNTVDPKEAIVTHDSGSPRNQIGPFYQATVPRSYIGWGKSHALGTGLGLIMGAKLAKPDKFCVHFQGDAAFGMTGLDFETAVRSSIPILQVVLNNSTMAVETQAMKLAQERYKARDFSGQYAEVGRALGGYVEKIEKPDEVASAIQRARRATEEGKAALLEFVTSEETASSRGRPLK